MIDDSVKQVVRTRALQMVHTLGLRETSRRLGVTRVSVARLAAGTPVRLGTMHMAASALGLIGSPSVAGPIASQAVPQ